MSLNTTLKAIKHVPRPTFVAYPTKYVIALRTCVRSTLSKTMNSLNSSTYKWFIHVMQCVMSVGLKYFRAGGPKICLSATRSLHATYKWYAFTRSLQATYKL